MKIELTIIYFVIYNLLKSNLLIRNTYYVLRRILHVKGCCNGESGKINIAGLIPVFCRSLPVADNDNGFVSIFRLTTA